MSKFEKFLKKLVSDKRFIIILVILVVLIVAGIFIYNKKYSPTNETMTLNEYYEVKDNEMALIIDGELIKDLEGAPKAIVKNNEPYIKYEMVCNATSDVFAYDPREHIISYTTKEGTYKATPSAKGYTFKGQNVSTDYVPFIEENSTAYLNPEYVKVINGTDYTYDTNPARCALYTPGKERTTGIINDDVEMRRFGGNRSKIVATAKEDDKVTVVENYGSWSQILTKNGILGCVPNGYISDKDTTTNKTGPAQESMTHTHMNEMIKMGWHQSFTTAANAELDTITTTAKGMNVISPTWYQIKDNNGGLNNFASADYVNNCHNKGIKVWALVSNIEKDVDENALFNVTSTREKLIDNLVKSTVAVGADGINVDMESVGDANVNGYVEFIKELALKCHENNLILSVDNYNLNSADYDVEIQARFADYIVLFGYDETWTGSPTAGSNNSIGYVKKGVEGMLDIGVEKSQLILAIPFYTRLWKLTGNNLSSEAVTLKETPNILSNNNATPTWLKDNKENYAEWTNGESKYMIWIVDNKSLKERLDYVVSKNIAGISAWKLGTETSETWQMISETLK